VFAASAWLLQFFLEHQTNRIDTRRPVKNRNGPIAGIAHTGGGGSRQLGPDDNDRVSATQIRASPTTIFPSSSTHHHQQQSFLIFFPSSPMLFATPITPIFPYSPPSSIHSTSLTECQGSPQSESDDFCFACKGTGEFVCCETCPRVFHYICCDRPRHNPPEGPFFCHECDAKANPIDLPEDSYHRFGSLFKQLRSTNTRSFALPTEVQSFYESVSARPDGSYVEETKKISL
jgi:hypothetical protein